MTTFPPRRTSGDPSALSFACFASASESYTYIAASRSPGRILPPPAEDRTPIAASPATLGTFSVSTSNPASAKQLSICDRWASGFDASVGVSDTVGEVDSLPQPDPITDMSATRITEKRTRVTRLLTYSSLVERMGRSLFRQPETASAGVTTSSTSCRNSPTSSESMRARQEASMMLSDTPTVIHVPD